MKKFGFQKLEDDREYGVFSYIAAATHKFEDMAQVTSPAGVNLDLLDKKLPLYSVSERAMIRFALQLLNPELDNITLPEVFRSLDEENVVLEAIKFRYKIQV